jgi:iron-only hydrogenase group A
MEEGSELLMRLKKAIVHEEDVALPQFTSCCPAWIKYAEHFYPELLPNISTCKSPQQMFGAAAKTYYAQKIGRKPEEITVVSIMPCTAKKFENVRPEMNDSGVQDVDLVLTTRELGRMIKEAGIDFGSLPDEKMDSIMGMSTGAADIFANTGGVMEAALRTAYEIVTGRSLPFKNLHIKPIAGLEGVKEASLEITGTLSEWSFLEGVTLNVAVAHGLGNAKKVIERIKAGEGGYHFVEIMACPGGCIGGGGQPRLTSDEVRRARIEAIYREDEGKEIRKSHENPEIKQIYEEFLKKPLGEKSHHLLHTEYEIRERV